ncbi:MAG: dihydrolipoyl dehydrogenase [Gammaproteobacteria bacterium WSBS_2016_MAG_OTU1]
MSDTIYDVLVIGGGPGGYVAAIRAAQLGLSTACVDKWKNAKGKTVYGGTCLNVGCIPSKALLESSYNYERAAEHFAAHGVMVDKLSLNLDVMQKRKEKVVNALVTGIDGLFKKNKITALSGAASISSVGDVCEVQIDDGGKKSVVRAKNLIIATGSVPRDIPPAPLDGKNVVDNEGALSFDSVPKKLGVIGAGVIGLELGSVWNRLGSEVRILEALPEFLAAADMDIAKDAAKIFKKQGLQIEMGAQATGIKTSAKGVEVSWSKDGKTETEKFDKLIVAVGRVPFTAGLNAEGVGLAVERGFIVVDGQCRTKFANVYAIGDVVRGPMLAHKAEDEGAMVAELIAGQKPEIEYDYIPWVIYTHPEIAWAGKTEQALKAEGIEYRKGAFPFIANGRARGLGETDGMVKMLAAADDSDRILGVHIMGAGASDLIAEGVLAMEMGAASEDIARTCHAHPTLSEAFREAALAVAGRAIHI